MSPEAIFDSTLTAKAMRGAGFDMPDSKFDQLLVKMGLMSPAYAAEETPSPKVTGYRPQPQTKPSVRVWDYATDTAKPSGIINSRTAVVGGFTPLYAGRSPINEVAREVFSGGGVMTEKYNRDELEKEFKGYTQKEQTRFNVEKFSAIANASKEAGAIYDKAQAEAIAQGGTLDISRDKFISDYRSQVERDLASQSPSGKEVTLVNAQGQLLFKGNQENYVKWRLSQEPSTQKLGKSYGMSMIPVYGTIQYGREAAKDGWTPKEVGLMAASIGADVATVIPPIGAVARASLKPALAGVMGSSRAAIVARNIRTVGSVFKAKPTFARPSIAGLKTVGREYVTSLKYPFQHPLETAKGIGGLASGKRILYPVPLGYKGNANQYVTEQLKAALKKPGDIQPALSVERYKQHITLGKIKYEEPTFFSGQTEGPREVGVIHKTVYPRTQGSDISKMKLKGISLSLGETPESVPFISSATSEIKPLKLSGITIESIGSIKPTGGVVTGSKPQPLKLSGINFESVGKTTTASGLKPGYVFEKGAYWRPANPMGEAPGQYFRMDMSTGKNWVRTTASEAMETVTRTTPRSVSVKSIVDRLGTPVDAKVEKLVVQLNKSGVCTVGSCEGHLSHGSASPWIAVDKPSFQAMTKLVNKFNKAYPNIPNNLRPQIGPVYKAGAKEAIPSNVAYYRMEFGQGQAVTTGGKMPSSDPISGMPIKEFNRATQKVMRQFTNFVEETPSSGKITSNPTVSWGASQSQEPLINLRGGPGSPRATPGAGLIDWAEVRTPGKRVTTWQEGVPSGEIEERIILSRKQQRISMSKRGYPSVVSVSKSSRITPTREFTVWQQTPVGNIEQTIQLSKGGTTFKGIGNVPNIGGSPGMNLTPENLAYMRRTHLVVNPLESHPTWMKIEPITDWEPFSLQEILDITRPKVSPITGGGVAVAQPSAATMTLEQLFRTTGSQPMTWAVSGMPLSPIAAVAKGSLPLSPGLPGVTPMTPATPTSPRISPSPLSAPTITPAPGLTPFGGLSPEPGKTPSPVPSPLPSPLPTPKPVPPKPVPPTPIPPTPTPITPIPPRPIPPKPIQPILPVPPLSGLGGGGMAATVSYQPTNLGYWEFGYAFAGTDPITGKVRRIKFKKRMRYGNVPTKVLRSRISGQVNSDSPYYKREYIA